MRNLDDITLYKTKEFYFTDLERSKVTKMNGENIDTVEAEWLKEKMSGETIQPKIFKPSY
jgi:hypothetical protein